MLGVALLAMAATLIAHHLGFFEAIMGVINKVLECYKCCTFWVVMLVLMCQYGAVLPAVVIAFGAAYLSHWAMLLFGELNILYNRVWQNQEQRRRGTPKKRQH